MIGLAVTRSSAVAALPAIEEPGYEASMRQPRLLYYVGLLFMGQLTLRPALSLTFSDFAFFAALLLTLPAVAGRRDSAHGYVPRAILVGSYLFALGALLSTFGSPEPIQALGVTTRFVFLTVVWFWLGTVLLRRPEHLRTAVACWALSLAASGAAAVAQLLWGDVIPGSAPLYGRMTGFAQHMNDLGGSCAIGIVAAIWLARTTRGSAFMRAAAVIVALLIGAGVVLSGSVGGLLAATAGVAVFLILSPPSPRVVVLFVLAAGAAFGLVQLQVLHDAPTPLERIERVRQEGGTISSRLETYQSAVARIEENPVVGVGLRAGGAPTDTGFQVHNSLLGAWYEGGLLAALGLVVVVGSSAGVALAARGQAKTNEQRLLATALLACFLAYLTFGLGAPTLYSRYGWVPIALVLAQRAPASRETDNENSNS
jgi:O-antigen ligase